MAKREKAAAITNIHELHLDIDYDKLAKAIVEAEKEAKESRKKHKRFRTALMGQFNGIVYIMISIFSLLAIGGIWINYAKGLAFSLVICIVITVFLSALAVFAFLCQQETFSDDSSDTMNYFNANISLVALVVALIALLKGAAG